MANDCQEKNGIFRESAMGKIRKMYPLFLEADYVIVINIGFLGIHSGGRFSFLDIKDL